MNTPATTRLPRSGRGIPPGEALSQALASLRANPLRTILTMLGIVIGVAAVIALTAIGRGAQEQTDRRLQALGTNLLYVQSGTALTGSPVSQGAGSATTLTWQDARAIARSGGAVGAVAPSLSGRFQVVYAGSNTNTSVVGTSPEYEQVHDFVPLTGRFFNRVELERVARVAVLGQTVVRELGLTARSALGKTVRIRGEHFRVVGTLEYKGGSPPRDQDDQVLVPLTAMAARLVGTNSLSGIAVGTIAVAAAGPDRLEAARLQTANLLRRLHRLGPGQEEDFSIRSQADLRASANQIAGIFTTLLGATAAISLVVGGIGIMNIMLVSVSERTREIGLRKAVGARSGDILGQFLLEAVALSMGGGILGVVSGFAASAGVGAALGWAASVSFEAVVLSLVVSMAVGLLFGIYPSSRAARLDPAVALRSD
ncbi:ABC transporter permease [Gloeobacter morelensis]|nr:ABC transporter permease [Gloeobacter morelensis]